MNLGLPQSGHEVPALFPHCAQYSLPQSSQTRVLRSCEPPQFEQVMFAPFRRAFADFIIGRSTSSEVYNGFSASGKVGGRA